MIAENEVYRVKVKVGKNFRELMISAPDSLPRVSVARQVKEISSYSSVQKELEKLGLNCVVEVIPVNTKSGPIEIAGLAIPDKCDNP